MAVFAELVASFDADAGKRGKQFDGYRLGAWVTTQRTTRDEMLPERLSQLEALPGWSWYPLNDAWETGFAHLLDYSVANGNCSVPKKYLLSNGGKLGTWVQTQRVAQDKMSSE
jgi:hypothetical protein